MRYSVIIPIYNAEKYLDECVSSIGNQKRNDVEIVLVNDGSIDNSLNICYDLKKKFDNIIIIDKKNSGSMDSWIKGVEASSGEYICFADSDDKIDEEYFEIIDEYVKKDYDIILFDFYKMYKDSLVNAKVNKIEYGNVSKEVLMQIQKEYFYDYEKCSLYRWDKVIKSSIIKNSIKQLNCRTVYYEDHPISFLNLLNAEKMYYIDKKLYYYRMRKSSVSHKYNDKIFEDNLTVEKEMNRIAKLYNYDEKQLYNIYLYFLYQYARWVLKSAKYNNLKKVKVKDIIHIDGIGKKLVLFFCKYRLNALYNMFYKIKNKKENNNSDKYFD